jgi:hypothetical protein
MTEAASGNLIELRVDTLAQLFHTLDPFPFRERDLDKEAEEFIVGWARELVADRTLRIVVHFPETEAQTKAARELSEAFRRYFFDHASAIQREINELFRVGRRSLGIGVTDPGHLSAVGASRGRLSDRQSGQTSGRREFSYSWLGRELATSGDISVRLVAARTEARFVSPSCGGNRRAEIIRCSEPGALSGLDHG